MWKCLAYIRHLIMSVHLSLRKLICGPLMRWERARRRSLLRVGCYYESKDCMIMGTPLLLPPLQSRMLFLLRLLVHLLLDPWVKLLLQDAEKSKQLLAPWGALELDQQAAV